MRAATSPVMPAFICTMVPPAKSRRPAEARKPPPHTQCAIGMYTKVSHKTENSMNAEKRILSATAPATSATVMIANVI